MESASKTTFEFSSMLKSIDAPTLDKIVKALEFEKEQHIKSIEQEEQATATLEAEADKKQRQIKELQVDIARLDDATQIAYKQCASNREMCESLKKNIELLKEHVNVIVKKKKNMAVVMENDAIERQNILDHYDNIWKKYEQKYESFPLTIKLREKQKQVRELKQAVEDNKFKLAALRQILGKGNGLPFTGLTDFIIKVANFRVASVQADAETQQLKQKSDEILIKIKETQQLKAERQLMLEEKDKITRTTGQLVESGQINDTQQESIQSRHYVSNDPSLMQTEVDLPVSQSRVVTIPQQFTIPAAKDNATKKLLDVASISPEATGQTENWTQEQSPRSKCRHVDISTASTPSQMQKTFVRTPLMRSIPTLSVPFRSFSNNKTVKSSGNSVDRVVSAPFDSLGNTTGSAMQSSDNSVNTTVPAPLQSPGSAKSFMTRPPNLAAVAPSTVVTSPHFTRGSRSFFAPTFLPAKFAPPAQSTPSVSEFQFEKRKEIDVINAPLQPDGYPYTGIVENAIAERQLEALQQQQQQLQEQQMTAPMDICSVAQSNNAEPASPLASKANSQSNTSKPVDIPVMQEAMSIPPVQVQGEFSEMNTSVESNFSISPVISASPADLPPIESEMSVSPTSFEGFRGQMQQLHASPDFTFKAAPFFRSGTAEKGSGDADRSTNFFNFSQTKEPLSSEFDGNTNQAGVPSFFSNMFNSNTGGASTGSTVTQPFNLFGSGDSCSPKTSDNNTGFTLNFGSSPAPTDQSKANAFQLFFK